MEIAILRDDVQLFNSYSHFLLLYLVYFVGGNEENMTVTVTLQRN